MPHTHSAKKHLKQSIVQREKNRATKRSIRTEYKKVIDAVEASCQCCGGSWRTPYHFLPPSTRLQTMAGLLICPSCGGREVFVAPAPTCGTEPPH